MLIFNFRKELADKEIILRPRLTIRLTKDKIKITISALLDSGADRTVIPKFIAEALQLKQGAIIKSSGIGGMTEGYESFVDITFIDVNQKEETIKNVPIYILPSITDVVIGRNKIFDLFRVTLEQYNNKIILENR